MHDSCERAALAGPPHAHDFFEEVNHRGCLN